MVSKYEVNGLVATAQLSLKAEGIKCVSETVTIKRLEVATFKDSYVLRV